MIKSLFSSIFNNKPNDNYSIDLHSHLIPNIDDGVDTIDESISIIRKMQEMGFEKLITTPHIMAHRFPNTSSIIKKGFEEVQEVVIKKNIDIKLEVAAEYYLDENFLELIKEKDILSFGKENYVLFELSYTVPPLNIDQIIFELQSAGYTPILAHPERYVYYTKDIDKLIELKNRGVMLQINGNSIGAFYGKKVKGAVDRIINEKLVDFIGSDAHSKKYVDLLDNIINKSSTYSKLIKTNNIKNHLL